MQSVPQPHSAAWHAELDRRVHSCASEQRQTLDCPVSNQWWKINRGDPKRITAKDLEAML